MGTMYRLLGPNVAAIQQVPELVARWKPPVALVMDHNDAWRWCKQETPQTRFVGRQYRAQEPGFNDGTDPIQQARDYVAGLLPLAASYAGVYDW